MIDFWSGLTDDNQINFIIVSLTTFLAILGYFCKRWFESRKLSMASTVNKASQDGVIQNSHNGQNIVHTGTGDIQIVTSLEDSKPKKKV